MRFRGTTIRRKIVALLLIPLVSLTAIWVFAATITSRAVFGRPDPQRIANNVLYPLQNALGSVQQERKAALLYIADTRDSEARTAFEKQGQVTDSAIAQLRSHLTDGHMDGDLNSQARGHLDDFFKVVGGLAGLRRQVDDQHISREDTYAGYNTFEAPAFAFCDSLYLIDNTSFEPQRNAGIGVIRAEEQTSREDALMGAAISTGHMSRAELNAFTSAVALERGYYDDNVPELSKADRDRFDAFFKSGPGKQLRAAQDAVSAATTDDAPIIAAHQSWPTVAGTAITDVNKLDQQVVQDFTDSAAPVPTHLVVEAALAGGLGLIAVIASLFVSVRIGRGLIRDLGALRREAQELSGTRLPRVMRRLASGEQVDIETEVPRLEYADDEIGQVGQALNVLQRAAVEAAVRQADMRKGVSDVFVNLARRSQVLLHRQLTMLDAMERRTEQPEELADLFKLDHMTTRMRRHAEGLVILSGAATSRQWRKPVQLMDVVRAAVAEVEDYERIEVRRLPRLAVAGAAVADLTHLLAELIENAAVFSPPHTQVRVHGEPVANGFVLEVDDRGLGLTPDALLEANLRLAETPEFELSDTDRLGLFVVSRLAQRHSVRVSLRQSPYGGTTAVVLVPAALLTETGEPDTGSTRLDLAPDQAPDAVPTPAGDRPFGGDTEHTFRQWGLDGAGGEPQKEHAAHAEGTAAPQPAEETGGTSFGLPRRRRRSAPVLVTDHGHPVGDPPQPAGHGASEPPAGPDAQEPGPPRPAGRAEQPEDGRGRGHGEGHGHGREQDAPPSRSTTSAPAAQPLPPVRPVPPAGEAQPPSPRGSGRHAAPPPAAAHTAAPAPAPPAPAPDAAGGTVLPRRVRQANLAPQLRVDTTRSDRQARETAARERSAEEVRDRMASLQRGWQRGRSADLDPAPADDDTSTPDTRTTPEEYGR
ncbi:putative sensor-like histidine kinase [Actinacidiphila reveromycinica]|uniref:histidine kinase n=1 Tax=Actinacidiphila reveromycinica TaxID=659352 RepID=A0A7U3UZV6_9ACTN|nr:nitrate- and nitrite sensing domain-containing protein [Streptomyces sp. SN-593]BBB01775.1 putative sensor-like histidine kinase [Streptomyces sp. SN-593]